MNIFKKYNKPYYMFYYIRLKNYIIYKNIYKYIILIFNYNKRLEYEFDEYVDFLYLICK